MSYRRILSYLIPLRILRGHLPSRDLLNRFPVLSEVYSPFIEALKRSDIKAYDLALYKWERKLLEMNVWLVFERARELVMRGLFRRVYVQLVDWGFGSLTMGMSLISDGLLATRTREYQYICSTAPLE